MSAFLLVDKVEEALATLVLDSGVSANVYTGKGSLDKEAPCVICSAEPEGEEDPKGTGNFFMQGIVTCKGYGVINEDGAGNPADPRGDSQTVVATVFAAIQRDDLGAAMNAAVSDLHVFAASPQLQAPESGKDEQGVWIDELRVRLYCCASALS